MRKLPLCPVGPGFAELSPEEKDALAPSIEEIRDAQPERSHFFDESTLAFFRQTLGDFTVSWCEPLDAWITVAPMTNSDGKHMGNSVHKWHRDTLKHMGSARGYA